MAAAAPGAATTATPAVPAAIARKALRRVIGMLPSQAGVARKLHSGKGVGNYPITCAPLPGLSGTGDSPAANRRDRWRRVPTAAREGLGVTAAGRERALLLRVPPGAGLRPVGLARLR
ncbi:hypothetical protein GCM10022380_26680 [Amycolatopsis tucumanensis]|uniref:Uncharacterized protein n=1 Tax=Amycolatopsis tucumanensis TaxID=401106 RepID=A0ABP7I116_9PSEU